MTKRKRSQLIAVAVALAAAPTAWVLAEPTDRPADRFGVVAPGLDAVVGARPVLHGRVPPMSQMPVEIRLYRHPRPSAPIMTASVRPSGSSWSLPLRLGAGSYTLVAQQRGAHAQPLKWTRSFSVSEFPACAAAGGSACAPA